MNFQFNNDLLTAIFETSRLFMGIYDIDEQRFDYINKAGLNLLQINSLQDYEKTFPEGFRKNRFNKSQLVKVLKEVKNSLKYEEEQVFINGSGEEFWGKMQITSFRNEGKEFYYIILLDISEQKKLAQHKKEQEVRFEAIFSHATIGIIMVDTTSSIILSNKYAETLFGYESGELIDQPLDILIPQSVRERHKETYNNYTNKPQSRAMGLGLDLKGRRKDGTLFPVEISLSHFEFEEKPYYISFINDITIKKNAEESLILKNLEIQKINESLEIEVVSRTSALVDTLKTLEASKRELQIALKKERELGELKTRFVSMASHEFRTPLTAIQNSASLIEKYIDNNDLEKRAKHTQRIKASVANLTNILEEFLSVEKLETGKISVKFEDFDLKGLIEESKIDLKASLKVGQTIVHQHIGIAELYLDKSLLRKIIINLCSNAIKFSSENSSIQINTIVKNSILILKVKDSGIGISEEDQKYLFDRFFRGTNVTNIQGTGLGLHIVARYLELLDGKIKLVSVLGEGTEVSIEINLNNNIKSKTK